MKAVSAIFAIFRGHFRALQLALGFRISRRIGLVFFLAAPFLAAGPLLAAGATPDLTSTLQTGLFEEEANHNLNAAIQAYQSVAAQVDKDRKLAATAIFRLGECYRKQGATNEAAIQYQRILRDFSDQQTLVSLSRENLTALGSKPAALAGAPGSAAARQEQRRLLEEEIKLVESKLTDLQGLLETGRIPRSDLVPTQLDLLELKRQLAALDAGQPVVGAPGAAVSQASVMAVAEAAAEVSRLQAEVDFLEGLKNRDPKQFHDPSTQDLRQQLTEAERNVALLSATRSTNNPEISRAKDVVESLAKLLQERTREVIEQAEFKDRVALAAAQARGATLARYLGTTPSSAAGASYKVQRGDTLASIAKAYGATNLNATIDRILATNPGLNGSSLRVGQEILIPLPPEARTAYTNGEAPTSIEAEEVKRIQALIKDSPDLINAKANDSTPLCSAAAMGQLVVAKFLLESGADVEGRGQFSDTPLHAAAHNGHKAMVELLLSYKANVQAVNDNGFTPLLYAANMGYRSVVEVLLEHGADVNARIKNGTTPLGYAVAKGFKSVAELLLSHGADVNLATPLQVAALRGDVPMAELLLSKGAKVDALDNNGRTALSYAVQVKDNPIPMLKALITAHADPNVGRKDLPLARAAYDGNSAALGLLLTNGANPNIEVLIQARVVTHTSDYPDGSAFSPLFLAVTQRHPDAVRLLARFRADVNAPKWGSPPIFETLSETNTLQALLESSADPNRRDSNGQSPLQIAVRDHNQPATELLLAHGADARVADADGSTPLHIAAYNSWKPLVELLLKSGADANAQDKVGNTPLHITVRNQHRDMVELLLANKADPNIRNKDGLTPLDLAKGGGARVSGPIGTPYGTVLPTPPPIPTRPARPGVPVMPLPFPGQAGTEPPPSTNPPPPTITELLIQHGALADLPRMDRIEVRRPTTGYSNFPLVKGTNDWNHFTLLEALAIQFDLVAPKDRPSSVRLDEQVNRTRTLAFPDLGRVRIRRLAPDGKSWQEQQVDTASLLRSTNSTDDVALQWGDLVEIPESDHPIAENWTGLSDTEWNGLKQHLTRRVEVVIKGVATNIVLAPRLSFTSSDGDMRIETTHSYPQLNFQIRRAPFWLRPALLSSGLLMASSDLSRVKVTRRDPATGQKLEWVLDCRDGQPAPDLWLRDGDVIDVPEKD